MSMDTKKLAEQNMKIPQEILEKVSKETKGSIDATISQLEMIEIGLRMLIKELKASQTV